jgi:mannose-1-phosphate guanylyltransferase
MSAAGDSLWAVILAGGRGARLWPLSRRRTPKQCVSLDGRSTMLQTTVARIGPLVPPERTLILTGPDMAGAVAEQLPGLPPENLLVEPSPRNTAPAIAWAIAELWRRAGEGAPFAVLPSDHHIADPAGLCAALRDGAEGAARSGGLLTLGVFPRGPETGYGYIQMGPSAGSWGALEVHEVARFTEKPDLARAEAWVAGGAHLWNAGVLVGTVQAARRAYGDHLPGAAAAIDALRADPGALRAVWPTMEATSVDYGVLERAAGLRVAPVHLGWSDLGTWAAVGETAQEVDGVRVLAGQVVAEGAARCLVRAPGKTVALLGVDDLVVIDTPDALLVMRAGRAGELPLLLARLDALGPGGPT